MRFADALFVRINHLVRNFNWVGTAWSPGFFRRLGSDITLQRTVGSNISADTFPLFPRPPPFAARFFDSASIGGSFRMAAKAVAGVDAGSVGG